MFGLDTLMESIAHHDRDISFDPIFEAASELVDDEVKDEFIEDSVEADMDGEGITPDDEKKYEALLKTIPEYNDGIEKDIDTLTESFMMI